MRRYIVLVFVFATIFASPAIAQVLTGKVIDKETNEPLPYVHIGIKGKNFGVISDENGIFKFDISKIPADENLSFAIIGYTQKSFKIADLNQEQLLVEMSPKTYMLNQVLVKDSEIIDIEKFGQYLPTKTTTGTSNKPFGQGAEWAVLVENKDKQYLIKDVNFHIRFNTVDSALFRINIYSLSDDGMPDSSLLQKQVFLKSYKKDKLITSDLQDEKLIINDNVVVSVELIRIWYSKRGQNHFFITHSDNHENATYFSRGSSFDKWTKGSYIPMVIYFNGRIY